MLAEDGEAAAMRGRIALPPVGNRFGYNLYKTLEARLGAPVQPDYRLEVVTEITERGLLVAQDNAVTRLQLSAVATMRLFRQGEAEPVLTDVIRSEAGFDQTASLFASRTTRNDIEDRLARDLGERISRRILAQAGGLGAA